MGARHALFPRFTVIWRPNHPSSDYWLTVPRRCAAPQGRLRSRSGPAAEPDADVATNILLGETSLPGFAPICRQTQSGHGSVASEISASGPLAHGQHPRISADRLPWATGLVSYPSNCILSSGGRPLYDLPRIESYRASMVTARPGRLPLGALNSRR